MYLSDSLVGIPVLLGNLYITMVINGLVFGYVIDFVHWLTRPEAGEARGK